MRGSYVATAAALLASLDLRHVPNADALQPSSSQVSNCTCNHHRHHRPLLRRRQRWLALKTYPSANGDCSNDDQGREIDCNIDTLWATAGPAAAASLPKLPSAELSAQEVITAIVRGLQYNDVPEARAGLMRCYEFMDLQCRKLVTGYGNVPEERTLEKFIHHAASSPKIWPFIEASSIDVGPVSTIAPTPTRGEIATCPVVVRPSADPVLHDSGFARDFPLVLGNRIPEKTFMVRLQKQRRPPLAGAYLVTDVIDVATVASVSRPLNLE